MWKNKSPGKSKKIAKSHDRPDLPSAYPITQNIWIKVKSYLLKVQAVMCDICSQNVQHPSPLCLSFKINKLEL